MGISLSKGGNISLTKASSGSRLDKVTVGLGWDARVTSGSSFDLDAVAFCVNAAGKVRSDADFIFYNQVEGLNGAIKHLGDNRDGGGDGDDEQIVMQLNSIPSDVEKIVIGVIISEADSRGQNFGMVSNAFVRIVDNSTGQEMVRYDLSEEASTDNAMIFAELYRYNGEWKFKAVGQGYQGGLVGMARSYGVNV